MDGLKYNSKGLLTAVVQDIDNSNILMVAMMNAQALEMTLETKKVHFWSRSRKKLWLKGETSGNIMDVKRIMVDCDRDKLASPGQNPRACLSHGKLHLFLYRFG